MSKTRELAKGNKDKREVREASKCHEAKAKMGTETGCSFLWFVVTIRVRRWWSIPVSIVITIYDQY